MKKYSTFVGMDLGDRKSLYCVVNEDGEVVGRGTVSSSLKAMKIFLERKRSALFAIETGTHSPWVSRLARELEIAMVVANPRKVRAIYENDTKSDEHDAEMLARLVRADPRLLSPIHHRGAQAQADLAVVKARDGMVSVRTKLINQVRGLLKSNGHRARSCSADSFHRQVAESIPEELAPALGPLVEMIGVLTEQIRKYDRNLEALCETRYPQTGVLRSVPGVGPVTSLAYVLTLEDPRRFATSRCVGPYLGLTPRRDQSGATDKQLRITKAGNGYVRRLLVSCAQYLLGPFAPDCALRRWGLRMAERGGRIAKRRAVVAVARKLAVLLHRLWSTGELYRGCPEQTPGQSSAACQAAGA